MQTPLCIIVILLSVALFWIGMVRSNSTDEISIESIEAMSRSDAGGDGEEVEAEAIDPEPSTDHLGANERARTTWLIELPPAQPTRSRAGTLSLKESYLYLHKEFISSEQFLGHFVRQIKADDKITSLFSGSLVDGLIPLNEILLQRLTFSLEGTDGRGSPSLVLEALGETPQAAQQLAALTQGEYLRFAQSNQEKHPQMVRLETQRDEAREAMEALESDLAAYHRRNNKPFDKNQDADILTQLISCRAEISKVARHLREISQTFSANPNGVEFLADLESLAEFETIKLMREKLRQLEKLITRYKSQGNSSDIAKIKQLETTAKELRNQVPKEIYQAIKILRDRLKSFKDQEMLLQERLVGAQEDLARLALNFPKAAKLQDVRQTVANLEEQLKNLGSRWHQARKHLRLGDLSKSLPPRYLQPLVP